MADRTETDIEADIASATEVSRRRIVTNAIANYVNLAISALLMLFLQAYIIRTLGRNEYALWPLAATCVGFLALIPVGVGSGAGRFLAYALAKKKLEEVSQITTSLFFSMCAAAVLYAGASVVFSIFFERIFDIPAGADGIGPWVMLFLGLAGAVAMPFGVFNGGLIATQRYVVINAIRTTAMVLRVGLVVIVFILGYRSLIWVAVINFIFALCSGIALWFFGRRLVPWQRVRLRSFNWSVLRKVTNYSGLTLIISIAGLLYWQTDNIVINKLLDPSLLTGYAVVVSFVLGVYQLVSRGSGVLMPVVTVLYAKGDTGQIARLLYRGNRIVVPLAVPLYLFLILFGRELLTLYIGSQYVKYAVLFPILASAGIVSCTQMSSGSVPQAYGRLGVVTTASMTLAVSNVILSIIFVVFMDWGLIGVASGTAIVTIIGRGVWQPWYTAYLLKLKWLDLLTELVIIPLVHCLPVAVVMMGLRIAGLGESWMGLLLILVISLLAHVVYMTMHGLVKEDRRLAQQSLAKIIKPLLRLLNEK